MAAAIVSEEHREVSVVVGETLTIECIFSLVGASSTHQVAAAIVSEEQREVSVVVGETLTIECIATGWPVPTVTWSRYGGQLPRQRYHQLNGTYDVYLSNAS